MKAIGIQLCIDHRPIAQIIGSGPLPVLNIVEKPGRVSEPLAVLDHEKLVGYEIREGGGELCAQNEYVCTIIDLKPCGNVGDLKLFTATSIQGRC